MSSRPTGQSRVFGRWRLVIALAVLGYVAAAFGGVVVSGYRLNQQADSLRREMAELKAQNERLQKQVQYLESDAALEMLAREQLGWVRPSETGIVTVPPKKTVPAVAAGNPPSAPSEKPKWQRWWEFLFGT